MNRNAPASLAEQFEARFGAFPDAIWQAPGRVNLIGEHTDYNGGHVLPCALDLSTTLSISSNGTSEVRLASANFGDSVLSFDVRSADVHARTDHWSRYVSAVFAAMQANGYKVGGCDLRITSTVPDGAGLSSSAALETVLCAALSDPFSLGLDLLTIAKLGQYAENTFVDCQCGIMDQLVSASAVNDHALLIDCERLTTRPVPLPKTHGIFVIHSGVRRGLVDSEYNRRREECEVAARAMGVSSLCQGDLSRLQSVKGSLSVKAFHRARHVLTEEARCLEMATMLSESRVDQLSELMSGSHASLRDDFEVSTPEVDLLVDRLADGLGSHVGVRMTGGGFGGCVVVVAPPEMSSTIENSVLPWYAAHTGKQPKLWAVTSSNGVSKLEL